MLVRAASYSFIRPALSSPADRPRLDSRDQAPRLPPDDAPAAGQGTKKAPDLAAGTPGREKRRSEYEGIICKVLGGQLLCARHQRERLHRSGGRGGDTGLRVGPSWAASHDQGGDAGSEQLGLAHLNPPSVLTYCLRVK